MSHSPLDKPSVTEQVRRAAAGDREAWDDLLNAHRARLRKMVAVRLDHRLQARLDPSDVIQEAFVDATAGFAEFAARQEMPFFLWLRWLTGIRLSTLHRKHLQYAIRNAVRDVPLGHAGAPCASSAILAAHLLGHDTSASAIAMRLERKARIQEAIEALEPLDREVLVLRHFEELTNIEVAQTLEIQEAAASKRYVRTLRRLKVALSAMPGGSVEFRP